MNANLLERHRVGNALQSLLLLGGMLAILALIGRLLAGPEGMVMTLIAGAFLLLIGPRISPALMLRLYGARPLSPSHAPRLHALLRELSARAGLGDVPELHYLPSRVMNAFTVGSRRHAAVAVSDGLLRAMNLRELAGVLAHELSHVRHNDMWVMGLADMVSRLTGALSFVGLLLVLVNLPLLMFTELSISWFAILLLVLAPSISALLQLALSRTREYEADRGAVALTGDPRGLASALAKLERYPSGLLERILLPGRRMPDPSLLRTHPHTQARIERLLSLSVEPDHPALRFDSIDPWRETAWPRIRRSPRMRPWFGVWH
ncbi:MAG: zinc metalloprotease HtpX [Chromatiales bacterium]|jgi:heat shock protein HtpX